MEKYIIKFILFLLIISGLTATAQDEGLPLYERNSLTVILLDFNDQSRAELIRTAINNFQIPNKFNNNQLDIKVLNPDFNPQKIRNEMDQLTKNIILKPKINQPTEVSKIIGKQLDELLIGKKIFNIWYPRNENGEFLLDTIKKRAFWNAKSPQWDKANYDKMGEASIVQAALELIPKSYVLVLDFSNIQTCEEAAKINSNLFDMGSELLDIDSLKTEINQHGFVGTMKGFLYQLDYNDTVRGLLYADAWIHEDDDKQLREQKMKAFNEIEIPLKFILCTTAKAKGCELITENMSSDQEMINKMVDNGINNFLYAVSKYYKPFQVTTPLISFKPLAAEIGLKEGVKIDQRYFLVERSENKTGENKEKVKGVVRPKFVANNLRIENDEHNVDSFTKFYQVSGKKPHYGTLLKQSNDVGLGIYAGKGFGEYENMNFRLEYRISKAIGAIGDVSVTSVNIFFGAGFESKAYKQPDEVLDVPNEFYDEKVQFTQLKFGIVKELYFARNLHFAPFMAYGLELAKNDEDKFSTGLIDLGTNLGISVLYNLQILGSLHYYVPVGIIKDKDNNYVTVNGTNATWDELFKDRSGISFEAGLRFQF